MKYKKTCFALVIFALLLTISFISIDRNISTKPKSYKIHLSSKPIQPVLFTAGVVSGPVDLDPQRAWDSASFNVINQVCEGLFANNLSDPELAIIPNLALSGTWNPAGTEFTCILRQGVTFHDGAPFNADAVVFTWNRLSWFINASGTLSPSIGISQIHSLYKFPDGTPIVLNVSKNNDYNVTFFLNAPYAALESLLCFSGSYMLSPSSTPATAYIDTMNGDLVGTGPFVYDGYIANVDVNFHAYENYWQGKANISAMKYQIIDDTTTRNEAFLAGDVHFIDSLSSSYFSAYKTSPTITFLNTSTTAYILYYLAMNNHKINRTFREAISYAIDYDYILHELQEGVERLKSPIPKGMLYANDTLDVPILNLVRARSVMQSMGFGLGLIADNDTTGANALAWRALSIRSWNYSYNVGNQFREDLGVLLADNLDLIGIDVIDQGMSWADFIYRAYGYMEPGGLDSLDLFWIGWGADFNDPSNLINVLFTNRTVTSNAVQYNGYTAAIEAGRNPLDVNDNVQLLMEAALSEINPVARDVLYDRIQELLIEEDYPWGWGYSPYIYNAFDRHLTGFQQNALDKTYFYPCIWNKTGPVLPGSVNIFSDADNPDSDGNFNVTWSPSTYTDNYSLCFSTSPITVIDGSVTFLLDEVTDTSYEVIGLSEGIYYFLVIAWNGNGNNTSSNLIVNVELGEPPSAFILFSDAENPDLDGDFTLNWTPSSNADTYSLYVYSSPITDINGSLTLLLNDVTDLSYEEYNYAEGTYYFVVVAKNSYGTTMSNNLVVVVGESEPPPVIPGFQLWTLLITSATVALITLYRKRKNFN